MDISEALDLVALAESVDEHILGDDAASWTERLNTRAEKLRTAADAILRSGDETGALRLVGALSRYAQRADGLRRYAISLTTFSPRLLNGSRQMRYSRVRC